jgi:hypothetical protein
MTPEMHQKIERPRNVFGWFAASIGLHVTIIAAIVYISPLGTLMFGSSGEQEEMRLSGDRLANMVEEFRTSIRGKVRDDVDKLIAGQKTLMGIRDRKFKQASVTLAQAPAGKSNVDVAPVLAKYERLALTTIYDTCLALESSIADRYQEIRGAKVMLIREGSSFAEAFAGSRVPRPAHPVFEAQLLNGEIRRSSDLNLFKERVALMQQEIRNIANYTGNLVKMIEAMEANEGVTVELVAREGGDAGAYNGPPLRPDEIFASHEYKEGAIKSLPGRKLLGTAPPTLWMYVDTWWTLGPFDSRGRRDLDSKFLPEAIVDLDAEYPGKMGTVRWNYHQYSRPRIEPVDSDGRYNVHTSAIYYGYTRIYSDAKRKVWMAMGSDDYGKLWINDQLIWVSPKNPKPYKEDENMQEVELQQGVNKVLFRCENAGGTMGWCLFLCTKPSQ